MQLADLMKEDRARSGSRRGERLALVAGAAITAALTLVFFLLYWNRFVGLRSGDWSFSLGLAWLEGKLPYRDYFCIAPPLNFMKSALVLKLFGAKMIALRGFAVFERVLLALTLYFWLARLFRQGNAAAAAVVAVAVSAGDGSDPLSSYNHDTILWTVAAGLLASYALDGRRARMIAGLGLLSGICTALGLCTKQTIGVGATVGIPVTCAILLWRLDGVRKAGAFIAGFSAGWAIPIGALFVWLASYGQAGTFLQEAFVRGPQAKSLGGNQFLARTLDVATSAWPAVVTGILALLAVWRVVRRSSGARDRCETSTPWAWIPITALGAAAILSATVLSHGASGIFLLLPMAAIYFVYLACPIIGIECGWLALTGTITRRQAQFCLFAAVSFVVAFMLSLSFPVVQVMVIPGLGFLIAAALDGCAPARRWIGFGFCALLLFTETCTRLEVPHRFEGFSELPAREATARSQLPEMSGFLLPPGMARLIDGAVSIVRENTKPGDTIFTYPGLGLFYSLTGRSWPTLSGDENIDVVNDSIAREEARTLLKSRPKVIIYCRQPEDYLEVEERLWRNGRPSGQRDIIAALETLIGSYRLAGTFEGAFTERTVLVYVRP